MAYTTKDGLFAVFKNVICYNLKATKLLIGHC